MIIQAKGLNERAQPATLHAANTWTCALAHVEASVPCINPASLVRAGGDGWGVPGTSNALCIELFFHLQGSCQPPAPT